MCKCKQFMLYTIYRAHDTFPKKEITFTQIVINNIVLSIM